jgi:hypothetical protein
MLVRLEVALSHLTQQVMNDSDDPAKNPPVQWVGRFLLILGATICGVFLTRQIREFSAGHTYYEYLAGGLVLAAVGFTIIARTRSKAK